MTEAGFDVGIAISGLIQTLIFAFSNGGDGISLTWWGNTVATKVGPAPWIKAPRETWLTDRDSITHHTYRILPSSLFPRKGTLVPIPINSLEHGAGMDLPRKLRWLYDTPSGVE